MYPTEVKEAQCHRMARDHYGVGCWKYQWGKYPHLSSDFQIVGHQFSVGHMHCIGLNTEFFIKLEKANLIDININNSSGFNIIS